MRRHSASREPAIAIISAAFQSSIAFCEAAYSCGGSLLSRKNASGFTVRSVKGSVHFCDCMSHCEFGFLSVPSVCSSAQKSSAVDLTRSTPQARPSWLLSQRL